ncbi:MAG: DUF935 domain-containing protein [Methylobacter sp.]|uniref:DUF935 domain-containing protein n=1 Tax=Methylobacter sp. TaxID=2051955 RepID=UPI002589D730|nr:DUF935 domain-containing protein [Methylobacter sp.]MCL7420846.1 DUF935 domain-containing protein [Methylobacter sp.]
MVDSIIVDKSGKPMQRQPALKGPQTAHIAQLHSEFSSHPTRGLTPARLAQIFEAAERGDLAAQCDLFEDMEEKDGHILAELGKRKRALLGLDWDIKPPRNANDQEEELAGAIQEILLDIPNLEDVILNMADAIGYGYSCQEIEWDRSNGYWQPAGIEHKPPRWFKIANENRNELRLRDNSVNGAELWPLGWIVHIHKAKSGDLARGGLHRALAWPFLFKNYSVRDLAEFLEIYGLPIRLGQYPPGASEQEKMTLLRAVVNMGHAAAGIIPEGMLVEFKEAAKGGSDPYMAMMDWCERTQSKAILGGTLTSQADGKSSTNALGNVHNDVRRDLRDADAMQLQSTLTQLVRLICQVNGWLTNPRRCPRFVFDIVEPEDLALYAEAMPKLVAIGMPVPVSYIQEKLRIPEPEGDEPILRGGAQATTPPQDQAALSAEVETDKVDPTSIDSQTENLAREAGTALKSIVDTVRAKVDAAESLEALRDELLNSYGDLDGGELIKVMQLAFAAAELSGRFDVKEGA